MTYVIGRHPGAVWRKCDLQCHTPRDRSWSPAEPALQSDEASRTAWADGFVRAAQEKGLAIVAVTDHHDVVMLPSVLGAAERLPGGGLSVLAGVEITCKDPVQCLALFDPSSTAEHWSRLLAKLPEVQSAGASALKGATVQHSGLEVAKLFEVVSDDAVLRDKVLLLPHFGPPAAHKSLNVHGTHARAKDLPCDGFYAECAKEELDSGTLNKIRGKTAEWGSRRRALVLTGDNKRDDWDRLGSHPCWIRLGETSVEGLRQAFLADEARITLDEPGRPSERIVEMEVLSTLTGPEPVTLVFNEGFNAIIGGRGAGKSSMLEYLRFGLGKAEGDIQGDAANPKQKREREQELVDETLSDGWVRIVLERGGVREEWVRSGATRQKVTVTVEGDGPGETITVPDAQRRFPARAFHQKQLSTTMVVKEVAADNITGIAAAEEIEERRRIDQEIQIAKREVTTALQDVAALWQADLQLSQAGSSREDLERRLAAVSARLADVGVEEEDLKILADEQRHGRARDYLKEVWRTIGNDRTKLQATVAGILAIDTPRFSSAMEFAELEALSRRTIETKMAAEQALSSGLSALDDLAAALAIAKASYEARAATFDANYQAAKDRQATHGSLLAERERLSEQLLSATAHEDASTTAAAAKSEAPKRLAAARDRLSALSAQRRDLLSRAATNVQERSEGSLKAKMKREKAPAEHVAALCALFEGSRFRDPEARCIEWVERIFEPAEPAWATTCAAIESIYQGKIMAGGATVPDSDASSQIRRAFFASNEGSSLTEGQVTKIYANLTDQSVGLLLSATTKDSIGLTYVSDGRDIDFGKASPGQQASALLRLLLRQTAGTLIIDQPEDDLDNRVLMSIVDLVRRSKTSRQLIFATHNPNLVVNGDADKVVTMVATAAEDRPPSDAARINIANDGAIETPVVRNTITSIMEGGLKAFDLRARKYGSDETG